MYKVCAVFLITALTAGCEKQITYHQSIWSDNISKYCNLKDYNQNKENAAVVNNNSGQEQQKQYNKQSSKNNNDEKESIQNSAKNNRNISKIEPTNAQKKNSSTPKTDALNSVNLEANILKLNQVLNKNSKQSELARQEGQINTFSNETKKTNSGKIANSKNLSEEKKNITKNDANKEVLNKSNKSIDITKQSNNNLKKEGGNSVNSLNDNLNISIVAKKDKEVLKNDTQEFNSIKNEFSFGGL